MRPQSSIAAALTRDHALSRNLLLLLALAGTIATLIICGRHPHALWALLLFGPILLVALIDLFQTHLSPDCVQDIKALLNIRWFETAFAFLNEVNE